MSSSDFSPESISRTAFFTGHRCLSDADREMLRNRIYQSLVQAHEAGYRRFLCGCALGFDTVSALETIKLRERFPDVALSLVIPCADQADRWKNSDISVYRRICELADEKVVLSPVYYRGAMLTRNRYMADRSSLCICYMKKTYGGTASTVRYAMVHNNIRIINLAISDYSESGVLRENRWNCTFISPSVLKNADIVPLRLMQQRKLNMKRI